MMRDRTRPDRWRALGLTEPPNYGAVGSNATVDLLAFAIAAANIGENSDPIHAMLEAVEDDLGTLAGALDADVGSTYGDTAKNLANRVRAARLLLDKADVYLGAEANAAKGGA